MKKPAGKRFILKNSKEGMQGRGKQTGGLDLRGEERKNEIAMARSWSLGHNKNFGFDS